MARRRRPAPEAVDRATIAAREVRPEHYLDPRAALLYEPRSDAAPDYTPETVLAWARLHCPQLVRSDDEALAATRNALPSDFTR